MLRKFQVEELKIATNNFAKECLIGSGAFGNVYKGTFEGNISLAIKRARDDAYTSTKEFRNGKLQIITFDYVLIFFFINQNFHLK